MTAVLEFLSSPLGIALIAAVAVLVVGAVVWRVRSASSSTPRVSSPLSSPDSSSSDEAPAQERGESDPARAGPDGQGECETSAAVVEQAAPAVETPESVPSRVGRLRQRLARSGAVGQALLGILSKGDLSATDWEEIEDSLLVADVGLEATEELMEALRTRAKVENTSEPQVVRGILREELVRLVDPQLDRSINLDRHGEDGQLPASILMVGVNGTGKTTTTGKMARLLVAEGHSVLLGAADTFRAAAADQLATWGERVGVEVVRADREGADPASVAFEAVRVGAERGVDVVMVDTAGRLQTKSTLMDELGKVKRVMEKQAPVNEVLLVLDATTGQNGLRQAEVFAEVAGVTGIVLTKLDGSAKGGIVVSVQRALGVPVKFVGLGEGVDDLAPFDPQAFVDAIIGE